MNCNEGIMKVWISLRLSLGPHLDADISTCILFFIHFLLGGVRVCHTLFHFHYASAFFASIASERERWGGGDGGREREGGRKWEEGR